MDNPAKATFAPVTAEEVRRLFLYDPETGVFIHRTRRLRVFPGQVATFSTPSIPYLLLVVRRKKLKAHAVAWLYMTGEWGRPLVDHADRDQVNNRWANLRVATKSQNGANSKVRKNNTHGFKGVSRNGKWNSWTAAVTVDRKRRYLGSFGTPEEAHAAYLAAAKLAWGEFARAA